MHIVKVYIVGQHAMTSEPMLMKDVLVLLARLKSISTRYEIIRVKE